MRKTIKIDEADLQIQKDKLGRLNRKIEKLTLERDETEENVRVIERLLSSKEEIIEPENEMITTNSNSTHKTFYGRKASSVYRDIINNNSIEQPFKERQIREYANENGLRVKRKPIKRDYSRTILRTMLENEFIEKIDVGLFQKKAYETQEQLNQLR